MYAILNLDDITDITVLKNEDGITMLFTDEDDAYNHAEAFCPCYQVVTIEE